MMTDNNRLINKNKPNLPNKHQKIIYSLHYILPSSILFILTPTQVCHFRPLFTTTKKLQIIQQTVVCNNDESFHT